MKTTLTNTLKTLALGLAIAASMHPAPAIAANPITHTYVSGAEGSSDANPCTRSAPCATFADALNNTLPGGVITPLNANDYGPVTITRAVTIDGTETQASIVVGSGDAIHIDAGGGNTVILRHLSLTGISGANTGIYLNTGNLVVDDCKIAGLGSHGLDLEGAGSALVENTTITGCLVGVYALGTGLVSLRSVTIQGNQFGVDANGGPIDISHSLISQNAQIGLYAYLSTLTISNCIISANGTGVSADSSAVIRLTGNDLFNNTTGISIGNGAGTTSGIVSTAGNNHKAGSTTPGAPTPGKIIVTQ